MFTTVYRGVCGQVTIDGKTSREAVDGFYLSTSKYKPAHLLTGSTEIVAAVNGNLTARFDSRTVPSNGADKHGCKLKRAHGIL